MNEIAEESLYFMIYCEELLKSCCNPFHQIPTMIE